MPPGDSSVKGYIMPILTAIMAPALIAMFTAGWHFAGQVGDNSRDLAEAQKELSRMYSEGSAALKAHLQDERYADAKFEGVQDDVSEIKGVQKEIQTLITANQKETQKAIQELVAMQRELVAEIKANQKTNYPPGMP